MSSNGPERASLDAVLSSLGSRPSARPVGWGLVATLVLVGGGVSLALGATFAHMVTRPRQITEAPVDQALQSAAIAAYEKQDWDAAERQFELIRLRFPDNTRARDYLERIALTRRDAELLALAEEALVGGRKEQAEGLAARIAPNSELFAQAESLARNARADAPAAGREAVAARRADGIDVRLALGEAIALYEDGSFDRAASVAEALAVRASSSARQDLLRWAADVREFATIRGRLKGPGSDLVQKAELARKAIALDERLSHGKYARALRSQLASALDARAERRLQEGDLFGACSLVREAKAFLEHEPNRAATARRCEQEAQRRLAQARALSRQRPQEARVLLEQVRSLASPGSAAHLAAERALKE
jgi:hypothetical protein